MKLTNKCTLIGLLMLSLQVNAESTPEFYDISENYVQLVLAVGLHDPVYVDAYYEPETLKEDLKKQDWPLTKISEQGKILIKTVKSVPSPTDKDIQLRKHYLIKQLGALVFHAEQLAKKANNLNYERNFDQEAVALYDTLPPTYDYSYFDQVLANLDTGLVGEGDLLTRIDALQKKVQIPKEKTGYRF